MKIFVRKLSELSLDNECLRGYTDVSTLEKCLESVGLILPVTINSGNESLTGARSFQVAKELC